MIYKRCPRCGRRIPEGTQCSCVDRRYAEYDRLRRDRKAAEFYHSPEWIRMSDLVRRECGCDVYEYMTTGRIIKPDAVHHIIPLRDDWSRRLDRTNLIPLSDTNHSAIEQMYKKNKKDAEKNLFDALKKFSENNF